jgi:hypothetical protein
MSGKQLKLANPDTATDGAAYDKSSSKCQEMPDQIKLKRMA